MAERWVADVMRQRQRFGQILIQSQRPGDNPRNLRHFQTVSQPDPVVISVRRDEHLGLVTETAEGDRMNDPIPVTLVLAPRAAIERTLDRKLAAAAAGRIRGERSAGQAGPLSSPMIQSTAASAWIRVQS